LKGKNRSEVVITGRSGAELKKEGAGKYLHLGEDVIIPANSVVAIMDMETSTLSGDTRSFLKISEEEGFVETISAEMPKSFVITDNGKNMKIYVSPISSVTLQKRISGKDGLIWRE